MRVFILSDVPNDTSSSTDSDEEAINGSYEQFRASQTRIAHRTRSTVRRSIRRRPARSRSSNGQNRTRRSGRK